MCLAIPGIIVKINDLKAIIEVSDVRREIFIHLVPDVKVGDYVLVHAGCAIQTVDRDEALRTLELLKELGDNEIC